MRDYERAWGDLQYALEEWRKDCIKDGLLPYALIIDEVQQQMVYIEDKLDEEEEKCSG